MLVLTRKKSEEILINGNIKVKVVEIRGDKVRLGIDAPKEVNIRRSELKDNRNQPQESEDAINADADI